ncbi:hypothetical protein [Rhodococcus sp. WS3]|uniref:hypothetical protein n=1 Tax=Rhodococcus sp. WS3 TaxID=2486271 RepID=UPI001144A171|nr:hypothetical protein [Rhodococcus sp. WS3]
MRVSPERVCSPCRERTTSVTRALPRSVIHTDKATGATTALLLAVAQPRETSANVYFVVNNSLKLYFGELEPSR